MTSVSLDDILDFMKADKEERAKERERDREELRTMISSGVKSEVQNSLKPLQERQSKLESAQADLSEQFKDVIKIVNELKSKTDAQTYATAISSGPLVSHTNQHPRPNPQADVSKTDLQEPHDVFTVYLEIYPANFFLSY